MGIRAKMKCQSVMKDASGETVTFSAVTSNSEENKSWSKWTPSGSLTLQITNPDVHGKFVPETEYFVDIEEVRPVTSA